MKEKTKKKKKLQVIFVIVWLNFDPTVTIGTESLICQGLLNISFIKVT